MASVFLSYRRDDAAGHAGRLYDRLVARFGRESVFMDLDSIGPGVDWVDRIDQAVGASDVMLAVIGRHWLTETKPDGGRRLDDPGDVVRTEIAAALARGLTVVPVLVQGAPMPAAQDLPGDLAPLARRNAVELADAGWHADVEGLLDSISELASEHRSGAEASPGTSTGGYRIEQVAGGAAAAEPAARARQPRPTLVRFRQLSSWGSPLRVAAPLGAAVIALAVVVSSGALSGAHHSGAPTNATPASPAAPSGGAPAAPNPSAPAPTAPGVEFSLRPGSRRCPSAPGLSGQLIATRISCALARQVTLGYFSQTQSGGHTVPALVHRFRCRGRVSAKAFLISCQRGGASSSFLGVPPSR